MEFHGANFPGDLPLRSLDQKIRGAARCEAPVLICGAAGTGKGLIARVIHTMSRRKEGPFIKMECGTPARSRGEDDLRDPDEDGGADLPGKLAAAAGGTLFFDEIGDLPLTLQGDLLRFLEVKNGSGDLALVRPDVRFIFTTSRSLPDLVLENRFLEGLFYRIDSIFIQTSP